MTPEDTKKYALDYEVNLILHVKQPKIFETMHPELNLRGNEYDKIKQLKGQLKNAIGPKYFNFENFHNYKKEQVMELLGLVILNDEQEEYLENLTRKEHAYTQILRDRLGTFNRSVANVSIYDLDAARILEPRFLQEAYVQAIKQLARTKEDFMSQQLGITFSPTSKLIEKQIETPKDTIKRELAEKKYADLYTENLNQTASRIFTNDHKVLSSMSIFLPTIKLTTK